MTQPIVVEILAPHLQLRAVTVRPRGWLTWLLWPLLRVTIGLRGEWLRDA
mgnify:CR=1 FL=1